jgi:hypothetical protein
VSILVVANKNATALAQPGQRSFDDPTPWFATAWAARSRLLTDGADVRDVAQRRSCFTTRGVVEPLVQQQVLFLIVGAFYDDGKQRVFQATSIVPVGRRSRDT